MNTEPDDHTLALHQSILGRTRWEEILKLYTLCDTDFVLPFSKRSISAENIMEGVFTHGEYLGLFLDSEIVGCGGYRILDIGNAEIHGVVVHPDHRGKGYGKLIVLSLIDRISSLESRNMIEVSTWEESVGLGMFMSSGFKEVYRYEDPEKRPPGVRTVTLIMKL